MFDSIAKQAPQWTLHGPQSYTEKEKTKQDMEKMHRKKFSQQLQENEGESTRQSHTVLYGLRFIQGQKK